MARTSGELERIWPDPDRRDAALTRLLLRVTTGERHRNGRNHERMPPAKDARLTPAEAWEWWRRYKT